MNSHNAAARARTFDNMVHHGHGCDVITPMSIYRWLCPRLQCWEFARFQFVKNRASSKRLIYVAPLSHPTSWTAEAIPPARLGVSWGLERTGSMPAHTDEYQRATNLGGKVTKKY